MIKNIDPYPYINVIIALLCLAYPILLQAISRLDEKYESENIFALLKTEWEWKAFKYTLIASIFSVLFWGCLQFNSIVKIDGLNCIIENYTVFFIVLATIFLVIFFFLFIEKVLKYYVFKRIIYYLIDRHDKSKNNIKYFSSLSDLLILSIKKRDSDIYIILSDFFHKTFRNVREQSHSNTPVKYPEQYYDTVYRVIEEFAILKEKRNYLLYHRISGGNWLLEYNKINEISETTYSYLWKTLLLAVRYKQDDIVINHWEICSQYFIFNLKYIQAEHDNSLTYSLAKNQEAVDKREAERKRFIEFHYALGGLLTYKKRYVCIKRMFKHTQSSPPKYVLLPETMSEIFKFYIEIRDINDIKHRIISSKYPFPNLSGISDDVIKKWIMSYMAILFLRQYTITPYFMYQKPMDHPPIPNTQGEIKQWIEGLDTFKKFISEHLQNEKLLSTLNLNFITQEWCDENNKPFPTIFIKNFKTKLEKAYKTISLH